MYLYPVLISVYDRLEHLEKCIQSLLENKEASQTILYIASDAAKSHNAKSKINSVRNYIEKIEGFKKVNLLAWSENLGSSESINRARKLVFAKHEGYIFMEDDNIVSPYFLEYMNHQMNYWKDNPRISYIVGYMYPIEIERNYRYDILFLQEFNAWGYGCWKHKFIDVQLYPNSFFDKKTLRKLKEKSHSSYYIVKSDLVFGKKFGDGRRAFQLIKNNTFAVFPKKSLVKNIGHDGSGLNCGNNIPLQSVELDDTFRPIFFPKEIVHNTAVTAQITKYRSYSLVKRLRIILGRLYHILKRCFLIN